MTAPAPALADQQQIQIPLRRPWWKHSVVIGLAGGKCTHCQGSGMYHAQGELATCKCVYRSIFRACFNRFRTCVASQSRTGTVTWDFGRRRGRSFGRRAEEYMADFCIVSKRTLGEFEYKLFQLHFICGADWKLCTRILSVDRGTFFHSVYRVEQRLGRAFFELEPYALYPLDEYFAGRIERTVQ